jgi:hypothetical protein
LALGGMIKDASTTSVEAIGLEADGEPPLSPPIEAARAYLGVITLVGGEVLVCGGWDTALAAPLVCCGVLAGGVWRASTALPHARAGHEMALALISSQLLN